MNEHAIMLPFSKEWIIWNSVTLFFIIAGLFFSRNISHKNKSRVANYLALLVAVEFIAIQVYYIQQGLWTPQDSLPFHLCRLMWFNSMIVLLTRNQVAFELLLFVGMIGGLHSLLTPEFTHGTDLVVLIDYFFVHGGLIAVPMYCVIVLGMRPRKMSWIKACLYLQIFVVSVGSINYLLGSNYMYLAIKPNVENPFLIGDWPYYIIGLELAVVLHAILVYIPFYFKKAYLKE
jgi:hypothetical integral membrane protein (TIGR02206 family)